VKLTTVRSHRLVPDLSDELRTVAERLLAGN
jgi:hypothetical protein